MIRKTPRPFDILPAMLIAALTLGGLPATPAPARAQERTAVVLSSSSVGGETISCGCQKKELGGIARRASRIEDELAKNPAALVVDAGDFGSHSEAEPWMRTTFQIEMMAKMGYDALTIGPNEMMFGLDRLRDLLAKAPGIRVVSANVTDKSGKRLWDDFAVVEKGGVAYAVTGVTDKAFYDFSLSRGIQKVDEFGFEDMRGSLIRVLPDMRKKADVVVVLLHTGSSDAKRVLEGIDGIDVAVVGHGPVYKFAPEKVGSTLLVQSGAKGQYLGVTEMTLSDKGVVGGRGQSVALGETVPLHPEFNSLVTAFNKKYEAIVPPPKESKAAEKASS